MLMPPMMMETPEALGLTSDTAWSVSLAMPMNSHRHSLILAWYAIQSSNRSGSP